MRRRGLSSCSTPELAGKHVFAEALTSNDNEENIFLWPLLEQTSLDYYDLTLHETLRRAFSLGGNLRELVDPAANRQALPWSRAVTFSVTHDMPNNDGFRAQMLDAQDEFLANVYVICRDGGAPRDSWRRNGGPRRPHRARHRPKAGECLAAPGMNHMPPRGGPPFGMSGWLDIRVRRHGSHSGPDPGDTRQLVNPSPCSISARSDAAT